MEAASAFWIRGKPSTTFTTSSSKMALMTMDHVVAQDHSCGHNRSRHQTRRTRPDRPKTNGNVEGFTRTLKTGMGLRRLDVSDEDRSSIIAITKDPTQASRRSSLRTSDCEHVPGKNG